MNLREMSGARRVVYRSAKAVRMLSRWLERASLRMMVWESAHDPEVRAWIAKTRTTVRVMDETDSKPSASAG